MPSPFPNLSPERRGAMHCLHHVSEVLRDNPWGDPNQRDVFVYTPPGYDIDARTYPVVFVLAGFAGTGEGLLGRSLTEVSIGTRIDRLISEGSAPFIAVMPDCMTSLGGSQYLDSPGMGSYASYVVDELIPFVQSQFRTNGRVGAVGRSSGGYGALTLAMNHPERLHAVASLAGDMNHVLTHLGEISKAIPAVQKAGGPRAFVEAFWKKNRLGGGDFSALNLLAMSCIYSPDPSNAAFPAKFPVDFETGDVDLDVLATWRAFDPLAMLEKRSCQQALSKLDYLYLDAGSYDEYLLHLGARQFCKRLTELEIAHTYEEFPGGHRGTSWRYDHCLPQMAAALTQG